MSSQSKSKLLTHACNTLLVNKKIRYVCIIDKMGKLVFEKQQDGIDLLIPDGKSRSLYMKSVLQVSLQKEFDKQVGILMYNISHRANIDMISIPIFGYVVLISVNPNENCDAIVNSSIKIFEEILKKT